MASQWAANGGNNKKCSDEEFIQLFTQQGATETARILKTSERGVYARRKSLERFVPINAPTKAGTASNNPARIELSVPDGVVLVAGDGHYWPGKASTAHRAFVKFAKEMKPKAVVYNGDAFDGSTVSRFPDIGWENNPTVAEELEAVQERLGEIEQAAPKNCVLTWNLGNHDLRYEMRLASVAPQFRNIKGFHLKDHFPVWKPAWATWINGDVVTKHRFKGGTHATHNNVIGAGLSIVTNHLHSLKVTPWSDYRDRPRWGVDCGCLANPSGPQFVNYSEDNPHNHRSGFGLLTFYKGKLLWPELVHVFDDSHVEFRGDIIKV